MMKLFILIVFLALSVLNLSGQSTPALDKAKISKAVELNFYQTDKRGIQTNNHDIFYVGENLQTVMAFHDGQIKWKADIIMACGLPFVGKPTIRYMKLEQGEIFVTYGKHDYARVNILTGKITCLGAD
jgi:hypothetical protein